MLLVSHSIFAIESVVQESSAKNPRVENTPEALSGSLKLLTTQYPTALPGNSQLSTDSNLVGNFKLQKSTGLKAMVDVTAASSLSQNHSHFGVSELYAGQAWQEAKTQVFVGRKLEYWSLVDSDWQLGQWQPTFSQIDALKPLDQGLTGLFFQQVSGPHDILAFVTPVYIPSMGPDVQEKNGNLVSDSRWYRQPSSTFAYQGVVTRVVYSLDIPDLAKLASNPGGGVRYSVGANSPGFWLSTNLGYKPINSLLLSYRTILKTPEIDPRGEVTVVPVVGYHTIGGADFGYRFQRGVVALSYLADNPQNKFPEDNWFQQQPRRFQAQAFHSQADFDLLGFLEPVGFSLNYLRINGGSIQDVDSSKTTQGALFDNRFIYTNAATFKVDMRTYAFRKRMVSSFKYMREFDQKGTLVGAEVSVFPAQSWALSAGADILGPDQDRGNLDASFLNQFRANDRYYGGMSYVF